MNEFMKLPADSRRQVFEEASVKLGPPAFSMEKDYWVFLALDGLFSNPALSPRLTFKGGTSLSKVWKIIERFSEDIDIVVERSTLGFSGDHDPENAPTTSARKRLVEQLKTACAKTIRSEVMPALAAYLDSAAGPGTCSVIVDDADKDGQTLLVRYTSVIGSAQIAYIQPSVRIELGARSGNEPVEQADVRALIDEVLPGRPWAKTARVRALDPRRTFLEKAFLLHEEIHRPPGKTARAHLARHLYDLHRLIGAGVGERALRETELFTRVLKNRRTLFGYSWIDYGAMSVSSLRFCPPDDRIHPWRVDYDDLRREMIYGSAPDFAAMVAGIRDFEHRFVSQED